MSTSSQNQSCYSLNESQLLAMLLWPHLSSVQFRTCIMEGFKALALAGRRHLLPSNAT